ncbi:MAG TPA: 5-oxoprolinase subunit PxpB [Clostridia bacterium]|nr:5-oxoprolinase subunit PxpB [Clostridia bacterium]
MKLLPCGDSAVSVRFEERIAPEVHREVMAFARAVECAAIPGVSELVPSYCALMVRYDPLLLSYEEVAKKLSCLKPDAAGEEASAEVVELPVCYGGEYGPDLAFVAARTGLSPEEVVRIHSGVDYPIYMLGFTPGFPYLGGMDTRLETPRLETPRTRVEAGSVGIAGIQTGVYPVASPGGWRIVGRTPKKLYDPSRAEPFLLRAGQKLRFIPIGEAEFLHILGGDAR